jgi:hypothetical protein
MDLEGCGEKQSRPVLRYWPHTCLHGLRKAMGKLIEGMSDFRVVGPPVMIWTKNNAEVQTTTP